MNGKLRVARKSRGGPRCIRTVFVGDGFPEADVDIGSVYGNISFSSSGVNNNRIPEGAVVPSLPVLPDHDTPEHAVIMRTVTLRALPAPTPGPA